MGSLCVLSDFPADPDLFGNEWRGVSPTLNDLADDGGADVRVFRRADEEYRLDAVADDVIELGDRLFIVEVGGIAQAPEEVTCANTLTKVHRESLEAIHIQFRFRMKNIPQPLHPGLERE